jgi:hypothetical protein
VRGGHALPHRVFDSRHDLRLLLLQAPNSVPNMTSSFEGAVVVTVAVLSSNHCATSSDSAAVSVLNRGSAAMSSTRAMRRPNITILCAGMTSTHHFFTIL